MLAYTVNGTCRGCTQEKGGKCACRRCLKRCLKCTQMHMCVQIAPSVDREVSVCAHASAHGERVPLQACTQASAHPDAPRIVSV